MIFKSDLQQSIELLTIQATNQGEKIRELDDLVSKLRRDAFDRGVSVDIHEERLRMLEERMLERDRGEKRPKKVIKDLPQKRKPSRPKKK